MEQFHATTIVCVRRGNRVALGGDGQVTLGNIVIKGTARKIRRLYHDKILAGFAGATADAFTLQERFEAKLEKHQGNLMRAAVELTRDWRTDRVLRRLEAMLIVADAEHTLVLTGNGDVLEPSTAWRPSARAAPMPSRPRWRCCATPSCHPRPSSSSRWKSPATCASTPTRTTSSKRWANDARRAASPTAPRRPSPA